MSGCGCEDFPCCGHDANAVHSDLRQYCTGAVEDAGDWYDSLSEDEQEFADSHMRQCDICGEFTRPQNLANGLCNMCQQDPVRGQLDNAEKNRNWRVQRDATVRNQAEEIERLQGLLRDAEVSFSSESDSREHDVAGQLQDNLPEFGEWRVTAGTTPREGQHT